MKRKNKKKKISETKINSTKKSKKNQSNDFLEYLKKRPYFVGFSVILIIIVFALLLTPRQEFEETTLSLIYGKALHEHHLNEIEYHLTQVEKKLNGTYQTTLEDDYYYSFKEDILWLKQREEELCKNTKNLLIKQLAFNTAFEGVLIVNENVGYEYFIEDYEGTINSALNEKYFDQNFENNLEVMNMFIGEKEKLNIFLTEYNSIMRDYFDYKVFIIKNSNSLERQFIEANKLFILSDPLALS